MRPPNPAFLPSTIALAVAFGAMLPGQKPPKKPKADAAGAIVDGEVGKKLDERVAKFDREAGGFSGSVLVAAKGKVLLEKGYGLHDAAKGEPIGVRAQWDWASVSKQCTAAAVLKLQDQKKLKLDDPLGKHLPGVPKDKAKVTLRHLLNHTSGIEPGFGSDWKFDAWQRQSFEKCVLERPMVAEPGAKFAYSNSGYALAAAVVERVTGTAFEEWCVRNLFEPAGMKDACFIGWKDLDLARVPKIARGAGFDDAPQDRRFAYGDRMNWGYRGCGGTVATAHDMFLWDRALRGDKLLSAKARAEFYAPAKDGYALGWRVQKDGGLVVEHGGGVRGVVTHYLRRADDDVVVALACNYEPKANPQQFAVELARLAK
jgi:CubicO group peptidase (beta-lactamase class C family)